MREIPQAPPPQKVDLALARRRPDGTVVVAIVAAASEYDFQLSPEKAATLAGALVKALALLATGRVNEGLD